LPSAAALPASGAVPCWSLEIRGARGPGRQFRTIQAACIAARQEKTNTPLLIPIRELKAQGQGASEIAKALKIGRASVYRLMERLGA
jgi:DNA invertase Pin-like site-specific DNA recombinase